MDSIALERSQRMRCPTILVFAFSALTAAATAPAVELSSLWPNPDGLRWDYELEVQSIVTPSDNITTVGSLGLAGTINTPNGTFQLLHEHRAAAGAGSAEPFADPFLHALWRMRPDLRVAIEARYGKPAGPEPWGPLLLHGGYFAKGVSSIQMWQPGFDHATWTYLESNLTPGATFVQQLLPEFTDDTFLHGTVESIDAAVTTPAGSFLHGVRMTYLIDYGQSELIDEHGDVFGTYRSTTTGHVTYVPDVGPVEMLEQLTPYAEADCGANGCPPEITDMLGVVVQTITLSCSKPSALSRRHGAKSRICIVVRLGRAMRLGPRVRSLV